MQRIPSSSTLKSCDYTLDMHDDTNHTLRKPMMSTPSLFGELDFPLKCPFTGNEYIGNLDALLERITWPAVKKLPTSPFRRRRFPCWNSNLEDKVPGARKVIVILMHIGQSNAIESLLLEGLTDDDLPLCLNRGKMQSHCRKKAFTACEQGLVRMFLQKQWMVVEPILNLDATIASNLQLDSNCALNLAFSSYIDVTKHGPSTARVYKVTFKPGCQHGLNGIVS